MRDILFRGKRADNGEWVEGDLVQGVHNQKGMMFIWAVVDFDTSLFGTFEYGVVPETVGQFTGLTDKNGKKIFEGDIVKWDGTEISQIRYCEGVYRLCNADGYYGCSLHNHFSYVEIIGNIHDNPELL